LVAGGACSPLIWPSICSAAASGSWTTISIVLDAIRSPRDASSVSPLPCRSARTFLVPGDPNLCVNTKWRSAAMRPSTYHTSQCSPSVGAQPSGSMITGASTIVTFCDALRSKSRSPALVIGMKPVVSLVTGVSSSPR
jgi:hypothetical protein